MNAQLIEKIQELESRIEMESNVYRKKNLKDKLSWLKAEAKGNFVSEEDLKELKSLIIFMINKSLFFKSKENLIAVMNQLLSDVKDNKLVFRSKKGIKSVIIDRCKIISRDLCSNIYFSEKPEAMSNVNYTQTDRVYLNMQQFYLSIMQ